MKLILLFLSLTLSINLSFGQTEDEILAEALLLYNSEKASWHGTDIFLEKYPEKSNDVGGYLSYAENNVHSCIFFDQNENPNILAKISFNENFDVQSAEIDTTKRSLTPREMDLFIIRKKALAEMNQDTLFKQYQNTNLNPIPIFTDKNKKVFVLTGPSISGIVVLGNDYQLTFDNDNNLIEKKALHKNIIPIEYNKETNDVTTMHSHIESTGNLITSTDICTLMLYEKYAKWNQHIVISQENVSLWNCVNDKLTVMTREAWEKISDHLNKE